jgi:hypothetical protein
LWGAFMFRQWQNTFQRHSAVTTSDTRSFMRL